MAYIGLAFDMQKRKRAACIFISMLSDHAENDLKETTPTQSRINPQSETGS